MAGEIQLTATLHRPAYQALNTPQQAYILIEAMPTSAAPGVPQPVNFSLVLDRSGSMAGEKLRQMKAAANLIVDRLGDQDLLSVIAFDDSSDVIVPSGPVIDSLALNARSIISMNAVEPICRRVCAPGFKSCSGDFLHPGLIDYCC